SLVLTLFSVAVLFVNQEAHLLAAVQVIVYAGAIVVLFLFVIMLLGVDRSERLDIEPIGGQRPMAVAVGLGTAILTIVVVAVTTDGATGAVSAVRAIEPEGVQSNVTQVAEVLFTDYVLAFELTALLLTIAVVGAVQLAKRPSGDFEPAPESALEARNHAEPEEGNDVDSDSDPAEAPDTQAVETDA
ncbi:MAG: NADH-quinone oxidoreductase subunit J, partial [Acidimicrobiia bacterium]|nr:NADH-quinone oxidoreductase subunit J [Acidimicrobiia bacterium]